MQQIKRFVKGGYLRAAGGMFGTIESTTPLEVTFLGIDGKVYIIQKSDAFKTSRAEFNRAVEQYKAKVEAGESDKKPATIVSDSYKSRYQSVRSANGHSSKICGDRVSKMLHGKTLEQAAEIVARYIGASAAELLGRYEHLNPGQRRMNIGNRLRTWARENQPELLIKE